MTTTDTPAIPVGTPVLFWPGAKQGPGRRSITRSPVWEISPYTVVSVEGYPGGIALTHVEILEPVTLTEHQALVAIAELVQSAYHGDSAGTTTHAAIRHILAAAGYAGRLATGKP
jgi:hypothetical protein